MTEAERYRECLAALERATGSHAEIRGNVLEAQLWYPRTSEVNAVEVDLIDVRAADSIRITYDFDRDGWSIAQASTFEWDADDEECDQDWQEVAFVRAWAREKTEPPTGRGFPEVDEP